MINAGAGIRFDRANQRKTGIQTRLTRIINEGRTGVGTAFLFNIGLITVTRGIVEALVMGSKIGGSGERNGNRVGLMFKIDGDRERVGMRSR